MTIPITEIRGIGSSTAETLANHGIKTMKALASATIEQIATVPGFSETRASKVKEQALALLEQEQKTVSKKRATKQPSKLKSRPAARVVEGMVEAMDEAGQDVEEAIQEALVQSKEMQEADHEAVEEMVEAMDEAGQDVTESLEEQELEEVTHDVGESEPELAETISAPIILAPEDTSKFKRQKRKKGKGGKKKKGKKGKKKGKKK